jgi:phosphate transport system substrate-binding protein
MRMNLRFKVVTLVLLASAGLALAEDVQVTGAGATFPNPIYGKWFQEFRSVRKDVQINYQSLGSGAGIKQLTAGTVDFGASDVPMTDEQMKATKVPTIHLPTVLGAVVPIFNVPGYSKELKLSGETLANIYLGKITSWGDKALAADNPGLPDKPIVVIHRAGGSGTTFIFTDYLSKVSPDWKAKAGANASVSWPVAGLGGNGNEGVTGLVKQTPYAIGYVEMVYALQNKIPNAAVKNSSGKFVHGELANVTEAAAGAAKSMPADFRVSITNGAGKDAYPIASFTWLLIPSKITDANKRKAIVDFLHWMVKDGQKFAGGLGYAPLPNEVAAKVEAAIAQVK